jgi:hypothetical protein
VIDADQWPDDTVLLELDRRAVCTKCGMIGADVRPELERETAAGEPDRDAVALGRRRRNLHILDLSQSPVAAAR